jgi:D-3-phosphoglycerate dehydrogenase
MACYLILVDISMSTRQTAIRLNSTTFPLTGEEQKIYKNACFEVITNEMWIEPRLADHADIIALCIVSAKVTASMIDYLPDLKVISRFGSGTDNIDLAAASRRNIVVTNVPFFCLSEVADHTMALLLGIARKLLPMDKATRSGQWYARMQQTTHRIAGRQLGLIGFGRIAQEVAKRAIPFGLDVVAFDPQVDLVAARQIGVKQVGMEQLLSTSHFVSLHVPLTANTRHLLSREHFQMMRPDAILINTARGAVVDEAALIEALQAGRIAGAALDVYEGLDMFGPLPDNVDHPLFHLPNVLLTPHSAGCSQEAIEELMRTGAQQAVDVALGRGVTA